MWDESDWERLLAEQIKQNGRLFFSLAHGVLRNSSDAEDVCQQALLKACEHRTRLRDPDSLRAWLCRIVMNESLLIARQQRVERETAVRGDLPAPSRPDAPHYHVDVRNAVAVALDKLPDHLRAVVVLRVMEGIQGREAARMLGITAVAVSRQLYEAINRLREHLADWNSGIGEGK